MSLLMQKYKKHTTIIANKTKGILVIYIKKLETSSIIAPFRVLGWARTTYQQATIAARTCLRSNTSYYFPKILLKRATITVRNTTLLIHLKMNKNPFILQGITFSEVRTTDETVHQTNFIKPFIMIYLLFPTF